MTLDMQNGKVVWHGADPLDLGSRPTLAASDPDSSLFLKWADPSEQEAERFEVYERALRALTGADAGSARSS